MTTYDAKLKIDGQSAAPVPVVVDLTENRLTMIVGHETVAEWQREQMRISAMPDGFHIRADGEFIVLDVNDDARFAIELGLKNAHPHLRQKMAELMREEHH